MSVRSQLANSPLGERLLYYLARARAWWRRTTVSGLAIRVGVWATGLAAVLLALPPQVQWTGAVPVAAVLALLPAALPHGRAVSVLLVVAIGLLAAQLIGAGGPSLGRVGLLAATLYLHHSCAALAAQLRTDAVVPVAVVRHWALRVGVVLGATAGLAGFMVVLPGLDWSATGHIALGVAAALAVVAALVWPLRFGRS